jgi:hypothetical protein
MCLSTLLVLVCVNLILYQRSVVLSTQVVHRATMNLLPPMLNNISLLNCAVSRDSYRHTC